jgi:hypothetical protein
VSVRKKFTLLLLIALIWSVGLLFAQASINHVQLGPAWQVDRDHGERCLPNCDPVRVQDQAP